MADTSDRRPNASRMLAVYRLLQQRPGWGIDEVAGQLRLTGEQVRGELDELVSCGLIRTTASSAAPATFDALDPELGLALFAERARQELTERAEAFNRARSHLQGLLQDVATRSLQEGACEAEEFVPRPDVTARLELLVRRSTRELLVMLDASSLGSSDKAPAGGGWWDPGARIKVPVQVPVRMLVPDVALAQEPDRMFLATSGGPATTVRCVQQLTAAGVVCDGELVLLPVNSAEADAGAVVCRRPAVVQAVCGLFDSVWTSATPWGAAARVPPPAVAGATDPAGPEALPAAAWSSSVDRSKLLAALESGCTDQAIARSLGLSLRTVQRAVADLEGCLGAATRFPAGVRAAQRGLVSLP